MSLHRHDLPLAKGGKYLSDGGIETTLVFHHGIDLPYFAAFVLLDDATGQNVLREYYRRYIDIAERIGAGFVFESATWRASGDWAAKLGYSAAKLADANRQAIALMADLRQEMRADLPALLSGCLGPRGDGYDPRLRMTSDEAADYHAAQVATFAGTEADFVTAITMNYTEEAVGIARAAKSNGLPVAISFTVETDGRLPTGQPLGEAIDQVDRESAGVPLYYMINCAHPTHFAHILEARPAWAERIWGVRANASRRSHAELDGASDLDAGDPAELAAQYAELLGLLPNLRVFGGCCGTDHRHVGEIAETCCRQAA